MLVHQRVFLPFSRHHQRPEMAVLAVVVQPSCCQPNRLGRSERRASDGLIPPLKVAPKKVEVAGTPDSLAPASVGKHKHGKAEML